MQLGSLWIWHKMFFFIKHSFHNGPFRSIDIGAGDCKYKRFLRIWSKTQNIFYIKYSFYNVTFCLNQSKLIQGKTMKEFFKLSSKTKKCFLYKIFIWNVPSNKLMPWILIKKQFFSCRLRKYKKAFQKLTILHVFYRDLWVLTYLYRKVDIKAF